MYKWDFHKVNYWLIGVFIVFGFLGTSYFCVEFVSINIYNRTYDGLTTFPQWVQLKCRLC